MMKKGLKNIIEKIVKSELVNSDTDDLEKNFEGIQEKVDEFLESYTTIRLPILYEFGIETALLDSFLRNKTQNEDEHEFSSGMFRESYPWITNSELKKSLEDLQELGILEIKKESFKEIKDDIIIH